MSARKRSTSGTRHTKGKPVANSASNAAPNRKKGNQLPDLESIRDAFTDVEAFVNVVYMAFQANGRDGPEQVVLWRVIQDLERLSEQLDAACQWLAQSRRKNDGALGGAP